jgi:hypothetical protein
LPTRYDLQVRSNFLTTRDRHRDADKRGCVVIIRRRR